MEQIKCQDLCIGYGNKTVLEDLSFIVEKGDYMCIVGENGSGKSTLMKALLGIKSVKSGEIIMDKSLRTGGIGYLPQQRIEQQDFPATVREIVMSGCQGSRKHRPFYNREEKKIAEENMKKLGLANLAKKSFSHLSGGQKQRVLLARALCAGKELLILDEPISGLDPKATEEMYALIKSLNNSGVTIIMVTHDVDEATEYANKVLRLGAEGGIR